MTSLKRQLEDFDKANGPELKRLRMAMVEATNAYDTMNATLADNRNQLIKAARDVNVLKARLLPVQDIQENIIIVTTNGEYDNGIDNWPLSFNYVLVRGTAIVDGSCSILGRSKYPDCQTRMYEQTTIDNVHDDRISNTIYSRVDLTPTQISQVIETIDGLDDDYISLGANIDQIEAEFKDGSFERETVEYGDWDDDPKLQMSSTVHVNIFIPYSPAVDSGEYFDNYASQILDETPDLDLKAIMDPFNYDCIEAHLYKEYERE